MRVLKCKVENFGSYRELEFDFSNLGLAMISGPTGSGKSTVLDIIPWVAYAQTAKGGSVEDIRSWQSDGNATTGVLEVELSGSVLRITRIRGKAGQNDLYWTENEEDRPHRGKDLSETQRLLEARLGVSADLYLTAAYFNEFSQTGGFFSARASQRREVLERVADLRTPTELGEAATLAKKRIKDTLAERRTDFNVAMGKLEQLKLGLRSAKMQQGQWVISHESRLKLLARQAETFDTDKDTLIAQAQERIVAWDATKRQQTDTLVKKVQSLKTTVRGDDFYLSRIQALDKQAKCPACDGLLKQNVDKLIALKESQQRNRQDVKSLEECRKLLATLDKSVNPYTEQLEGAKAQVNAYSEQYELEAAQESSYAGNITEGETALAEHQKVMADLNAAMTALTHRHASLELLYNLSFDLRGQLLAQAVGDIETQTNKYLEKYFDSEIKVDFTLDADDLEVSLQKSGHQCSYKQLSKGQRGLLKLCFATAVMDAAANTGGVHFSAVMMDEALDGLDNSLKLKAFRLLEDLSTTHETVLVVDHSEELQNLFSRKFKVEMEADCSRIQEV